MDLEATLKEWTLEQRELIFPNSVGAHTLRRVPSPDYA
jgi:hypothetical protein